MVRITVKMTEWCSCWSTCFLGPEGDVRRENRFSHAGFANIHRVLEQLRAKQSEKVGNRETEKRGKRVHGSRIGQDRRERGEREESPLYYDLRKDIYKFKRGMNKL
jgi:hypothetical protein